ncbi:MULTISPECIES: glycerol-3-phosphate dehydrogenase/oxidase [Protofrankia]|uniref:Glycerol-3-phosphate dehydrogenase n=1 Tax=Candidatus Protofrankia datiscae TaxID=2716812 RepID=F8B173_9ACTN|nr:MULTISPECIES: glycerol-3-phosphate dehydrogenase/oxidase [Protofrankia]AEH08809.1 Glycerol-3-phosphate dehydrogenase [Candidatus Protofrankia datiscae]
MIAPARLNPTTRGDALIQMESDVVDVVVIGGGVTGAGVALDAATRGLSVALVEARDLAAGTSSRSSKLIHGGLRYLEQLNIALVSEALRERALLLDTLCPHLVRPVPFLFPLTHRGWERAYVGTGMVLYDTLGGARRAVPRHRHLTRRAALRAVPALRPDALVGAIQYWDAQVDDARHTMFVARTAAHYGALIATSARVTGLLREGDRVAGVRVHDLEGGGQIDVRARQTINAAGVWTDDIQAMAGGRGQLSVRPSKGIHLLVPRDRIHATTGLILRTESSVLFVIPWGSHWIVGTTDTDWNLDLAHPAASSADIDYLLTHVNQVLRTPLTTDDITGVYAGLRPLLSGESEDSSQLSREHAVVSPLPGLTMVAGGKYTTYRVMARDAVDAVAHGLNRSVPPSCTDRVPLLGADGYPALWNAREALARSAGIHVARVEHLLTRYGTLTQEVLALVRQRPELARPVRGADTYLAAEAVYAASHEGALHLDDVLTRRTRISIETWDRGLEAAADVAELVAPELGWDRQTIDVEIGHYQARVAAERESQQQADDQTADAARLGAPDVRTGGRSLLGRSEPAHS